MTTTTEDLHSLPGWQDGAPDEDGFFAVTACGFTMPYVGQFYRTRSGIRMLRIHDTIGPVANISDLRHAPLTLASPDEAEARMTLSLAGFGGTLLEQVGAVLDERSRVADGFNATVESLYAQGDAALRRADAAEESARMYAERRLAADARADAAESDMQRAVESFEAASAIARETWQREAKRADEAERELDVQYSLYLGIKKRLGLLPEDGRLPHDSIDALKARADEAEAACAAMREALERCEGEHDGTYCCGCSQEWVSRECHPVTPDGSIEWEREIPVSQRRHRDGCWQAAALAINAGRALLDRLHAAESTIEQVHLILDPESEYKWATTGLLTRVAELHAAESEWDELRALHVAADARERRLDALLREIWTVVRPDAEPVTEADVLPAVAALRDRVAELEKACSEEMEAAKR